MSMIRSSIYCDAFPTAIILKSLGEKKKVVQMCDLRQLSGEAREGCGILQSLVYRYTTRNTLLFHCLCFQICSLQTHKYPRRNNRYYYYDITVMYFLVSIRTVVSNKTETLFPLIFANKLSARFDELRKFNE